MSGSLAGILQDFEGWLALLRPASFRGVPFEVDATGGKGGRRLVTHEFPLRDDPYTEDLGRRAQHHHIQAFVVGPFFTEQRDALISACQDFDTSGLLIHPTMGALTCRAGELSWSETKEAGGLCALSIEFVEDGPQPSPLAAFDTASMLLGGLDTLQSVIATAYASASLVADVAQDTLGLATDLLGAASTACLALPFVTTSGAQPLATAIAATPADDTATAAAVLAFCNAAVATIVAINTPVSAPDDPVRGTPALIAPSADLSGGLVGLAGFGASLPPPGGTGLLAVAQSQQQAAIVSLVQGAALSAVLAVYAQAPWPTANAAGAARDQVLPLIDAQSDAAAEAGADDLYFAWQAIAAEAMNDLIRRAQRLPALAAYRLNDPVPSLVLAQRFYRDARRADELELLNDAPHPLFMPHAGVRLSA